MTRSKSTSQTENQPTTTPAANTTKDAPANTTTTATATNTAQQDKQAQPVREPLVPTAGADNVYFMTPLPAAETKLLTEELLRTAHIMVRHTQAGKALMAKREAERQANTVQPGEDTPRQHLKWKYNEKFLTATKYLTDTNSDIQPLKLWDTPHFMLKPTDIVLQRSPAMNTTATSYGEEHRRPTARN